MLSRTNCTEILYAPHQAYFDRKKQEHKLLPVVSTTHEVTRSVIAAELGVSSQNEVYRAV